MAFNLLSYYKGLTLKQLFDTPWFFGEISEERAKTILMEASENDGRTVKRMIFLKADGQSNKLRLFFGSLNYSNSEANHFFFGENHINFWWCHGNPTCPGRFIGTMVMRKEVFKLRELLMVKVVDSGVNPETLTIPFTLKQEVKKYQDLITHLTWKYYGPIEPNS